jgi:hypothetical protein
MVLFIILLRECSHILYLYCHSFLHLFCRKKIYLYQITQKHILHARYIFYYLLVICTPSPLYAQLVPTNYGSYYFCALFQHYIILFVFSCLSHSPRYCPEIGYLYNHTHILSSNISPNYYISIYFTCSPSYE